MAGHDYAPYGAEIPNVVAGRKIWIWFDGECGTGISGLGERWRDDCAGLFQFSALSVAMGRFLQVGLENPGARA